MTNFFYYVGKFFKNFPAVVFVCIVYLMGARPYHVMVNFKDEPSSIPPHIFSSRLLRPRIRPDSPEVTQNIEDTFSLFNFDERYTFRGLEPAPFWSYLWNEVWMDWY